jgi:hypothetical protein
MKIRLLPIATLLMILTHSFLISESQIVQNKIGPNSSQPPYLIPSNAASGFTSILTAGDAINGYKMAGVPDGLGAFDNGNGTFTLLMNHELNSAVGAVRMHGSKGTFVSKWVIKKDDLSVISGEDLIKKINLWNAATNCYVEYSSIKPSPLAVFSRFCSADLPTVSAFYDSATGLGTKERIFLNGEEAGVEGRAFAHIVTGLHAGASYELPCLGNMSFENAVANTATGSKTVVAVMDDATPGQVYFYIGSKANTGNEIEKAGLGKGRLYGFAVTGFFQETSTSFPAGGTSFIMKDLGSVQNLTGADLQVKSDAAGITQFLRPEDGAWDPSNPNDFYFNTTNSYGSPSRLWKLHFTNLQDLTQGGTITAVLDGTEGQQMLDNMAIDKEGHILLQEDIGNNAALGKIWQYNIATNELIQVAFHDSSRFITGASNFLTQDEESSGIIDVQNILGKGMFLLADQAHYDAGAEIVEGGQLLAFYNAAYTSSNKPPSVKILNPVAGNMYAAGKKINFQVQASDADGTIAKVEFFEKGNKLAELYSAPYDLAADNVEAGTYILTAKATDNSGAFTLSDSVIINVSACESTGTISAEGFTNINGLQVADLMNNAAFPSRPSVKESLNVFEYGTSKADSYGADNYGARVRGYICAPVTGNYTFYISGDDQAGLWLSTDDNPVNKTLIAYAESWTGAREWNKFSTQKSATVKLVKGARYYIETLHKEYVGPDHLAVAWTLPNGVFEGPIPGNRLSPWTGTTGFRSINFGTAILNNSNIINRNSNDLQVTALPNPSGSYFTLVITGSNNQSLSVKITDIAGRVVEVRQNVTAGNVLQIGDKFSKGIYFAEINQDNKKRIIKLIKQ